MSARLSVARRAQPDLPMPAEIADLSASRGTFARLLPHTATELDAAIARLKSVEVKVTFGGRFKTGKSSLVDAALGERLLPTGDLPETGVSCHIRHGPRRSAALVGPDSRQEMDCGTADLRRAVTLRGSNDRVDALSAVRRVDIELPTFPGGPDAVWIDPPGLFDVPAMTARARAAIDAADVVVWVLRSQMFLGEAEMEEIADRVARRGWASVVFVENAYLRTGHPDPWTEHVEEVVPVNRDKMRHHAADMGFPAPPPVLSVSAEQMLADGQLAPNALELLELLDGCGRVDSPRVQAARYQWLHRVLTELGDVIAPQLERVQAANDATERANATATGSAATRVNHLSAEATAAVDEFVSGFESGVNGAGVIVAAGVSAADYKTDATYDTQLKAKMRGEFTRTSDALFNRLDEKLRRWGVAGLSPTARERLRGTLAPTYCSVTVANTAGKTDGGTLGGAAAGAAAGAVIGSFIPILGNIAGAVIGGVAGAVAGNKKHAQINRANDVTATTSDIGLTARITSASVTNKKAAILAAVTAAHLGLIPPAVEQMVDRTDEVELEDALDGVTRAMGVCEVALEGATNALAVELV